MVRLSSAGLPARNMSGNPFHGMGPEPLESASV